MNQVEKYKVELVDNHINYISVQPSQEFLKEYLMPHFSKEYIKKLAINSYMVRHPDTNMKTITYTINDYSLFPTIQKDFSLMELVKGGVHIRYNSPSEYDIDITLIDGKKTILLAYSISLLE